MHKLTIALPNDLIAAARCRYVLGWLEVHPYANARIKFSFEHGAVDLDLSNLTQGSLWLYQPLVSPEHLELGNIPVCRAYTSSGKEVVGVGWSRSAQFSASGTYGFDWVGTLFFWLSRIEEQVARRDLANAADSSPHWLVQHTLERQPQADRLAAAVLESLGLTVKLSPSRVHFSHDLDHVRLFQKPWSGLRTANYVRCRGGDSSAFAKTAQLQLAVRRGQQQDPFNNPAQTLQQLGGTLYLLLGRHTSQDGGQDRTVERIQRWLELALAKGYSVGLHPSFTTTECPDRMAPEIERFFRLTGYTPKLSRQHFLRWDWLTTPLVLSQNNIVADSSLGYRDRLGFRCGTSFPYQLYDFVREESSNLWEWPLAAMDVAWARASQYDGLACAEDWQDFLAQNAVGADLMLLVHNTFYYHASMAKIDLPAFVEQALRFSPARWPNHLDL